MTKTPDFREWEKVHNERNIVDVAMEFVTDGGTDPTVFVGPIATIAEAASLWTITLRPEYTFPGGWRKAKASLVSATDNQAKVVSTDPANRQIVIGIFTGAGAPVSPTGPTCFVRFQGVNTNLRTGAR